MLASATSPAVPPSSRAVSDSVPPSGGLHNEVNTGASRAYFWWSAVVTLGLLLVKTWWIPQIPGSALYADDYNTLNLVLLLAEGIVRPTPEQYIFDIVPSGLVYQAILTPLSLWEIPGRLYAAFFINAILGSIFVFSASLAASRISGSKSPLIPIAFATMGTPFIFSFYVMTENGVFALLGILFLFVAHLDYVLRHRVAFVGIVITTILLALTRTPGLAVTPALLLTFWGHRNSLGTRRILVLSLILAAAVAVSYASYMHIVNSGRETKYTSSLSEALTKMDIVPVIGRLVVSQLGYLFFASAFWVLPLILLFPLSRSFRASGPAWDAYVFAVVSGALFVGFCLAHVTLKMYQTSGDGWFVFGRYDDPALVCFVMLGVALAALYEERGLLQRASFVLISGALLAVSAYYLSQQKWMPINFAGLGIFASNSKEQLPSGAIWWLAGFLGVLILPFKIRAQALLGVLIFFGYHTILHGMAYTKHRAEGIGFSLQGSYWLVANTSQNTHVCLDWTVAREDAPGAIKRVGNVYRAMAFQIYPRPYSILRHGEVPRRCDYIYSLLSNAEKLAVDVAWTNGTYAVFKPRVSG